MRKLLPCAVAVVALLATLALVASADAAEEWHNGVTVQSELYNPCLDISEVGALAQTGFQSDPAVTKAGDVFYAHALFGAATHVGGNCTDTDQAAELDISPPPGVTLAIDSAHPINCYYADGNDPAQTNPTCPSHTVPGTYGQMLPAGDGGGAWDMPPGRTLEVQIPLRSTRELKGPAGGHCPDDLNQLTAGQPRDCVITPIHILDGTSDPWLLPNEEMFLNPAPSGGNSQSGGGGGGSSIPGHASLKAPKSLKLSALMKKGVPVVISVPAGGGTANLSLLQGHKTLAHVVRKHLKAGTTTIHLKLSRSGRARLRHARHAHLKLVEKLSNPKVTLRKTISVRR